MSEGLPKLPGYNVEDDGQSDEEEEESVADDCPMLKRPVRAEDRKTRKQRRKEREFKKGVSPELCLCRVHSRLCEPLWSGGCAEVFR